MGNMDWRKYCIQLIIASAEVRSRFDAEVAGWKMATLYRLLNFPRPHGRAGNGSLRVTHNPSDPLNY